MNDKDAASWSTEEINKNLVVLIVLCTRIGFNKRVRGRNEKGPCSMWKYQRLRERRLSERQDGLQW